MMTLHTWMIAIASLGAGPASPDGFPALRLEKGLELNWKGQFSEAIISPARAFRAYEIECRALVLDVCQGGSDVAVLTSLLYKPDIKLGTNPSLPMVRLQLIRVDPRGNVFLLPVGALSQPPEQRAAGERPRLDLNGLPAPELGMFLAVPEGKQRTGDTWNVTETNRPAWTWKIEGTDTVKGARSIRCVGNQQTADFDRPAITRPQWRRGEVVWISDRTGFASRVERVIEKRDPPGNDLSFRARLQYEYTGQLKYREQVFEDQRAEILQAATFSELLDQAIADQGRGGADVFDSIVRRIEQHERSNLRGEYLAYRQAVLAVKRRAEAAAKGHIPPAPVAVESPDSGTLVVGKVPPDFRTRELAKGITVQLSELKGKPVVLLYYQPLGKGAEPVLKCAQSLFKQYGWQAYILSMAIGDDALALKQRNDLQLSIPIVAAQDVYKQHGIMATPSIAILDDQGVVRKLIIGWTESTPQQIQAELAKLVK